MPTPNQSHPPFLWREPAGSGAVPSVGALRVVQLSPGVYGLADSGAAAATLVELSPGVFGFADPSTPANASLVRAGAKAFAY